MTETGSPPDAASELATLVELQDSDLRADQLRHQIEHHPLRLAQRELESKRAHITKRVRELDVERSVLALRQSQLEEEISHVDARVAAIEDRLRSASAGSYRDQEAMAGEIASQAARKRELEDEELEVMEGLEPLDSELGELSLSDQALVSEYEAHGQELAAALGEIQGQLARIDEARAPLVAAIPPSLLDEYQRLRAHLGGIGVARVVRGACSGCNLALSSTELDRVRHTPAGSISHCEQCGRMLVA